MKYLLPILLFPTIAYASPKFHYGDRVKILVYTDNMSFFKTENTGTVEDFYSSSTYVENLKCNAKYTYTVDIPNPSDKDLDLLEMVCEENLLKLK